MKKRGLRFVIACMLVGVAMQVQVQAAEAAEEVCENVCWGTWASCFATAILRAPGLFPYCEAWRDGCLVGCEAPF